VRRRLAAAALALFALGSAPAHAAGLPEAGPVRLYLGAGFVPSSATYHETRPFTEFAEAGHIDSQYTGDAGPGFEAGLAWRVTHRFALRAAVSLLRRKEAGSFTAALPHPFFFDAPRLVAGDFSGHHERETAVHFDLALTGATGRLEWAAFAGPSLLGLEADLVSAVSYTQAYPYDTVTVTGTPFAMARGHGIGVNAGVGLDGRIAAHFALAAQARWTRAIVSLSPATGDQVRVTGGGVQVTGGLRLDF